MSKDWDGIDDIFGAAMAADQAALEVDQRIEELALVLERSLPGTCLVKRTGHGAGPVRRLQVLAGRDCLLCERRGDGSWATSVAVLQGNVIGRPRLVPAAFWVRMLRQRLRERAREQGELADHLRGLLGD